MLFLPLILIFLLVLLILATQVHPAFWLLFLFSLYLILASGIIRHNEILTSKPVDLRRYDRDYLKRPRLVTDRVVISLTTVPDRMNSLLYPLISLLDQSVRVDEIQLNIPSRMKRTGQEYSIPDYLTSLDNIKIYRTPDYGPSTKLLPTLERESPETRIIYLDDDRIYGKYLIEKLLRESLRYPNNAICNWGWKLPADLNYRSHIKWWNLIPTYLRSTGQVDIMEGCEGCLVQPRFFDDEIFNYTNSPSEAFLVDDIWISGHLARCHVPRRRIPFELGTRCYVCVIGGWNLMKMNGDGNNNNRVIRYFEKFWKEENRKEEDGKMDKKEDIDENEICYLSLPFRN